MDIIIISNILKGIIVIANFYLFFMFVMAIMSILAVLRVIDLFSENIFSTIYFTIRRFIDPAINFIARFVPRVGAFDLPFVILLILLWIIVDVCKYLLSSMYAGNFSF